ncbi:MAG: hypothetical protein HC765_07255 [Brachymonas sp.]|nr:hypothetical protein [Brachymonas sp.]
MAQAFAWHRGWPLALYRCAMAVAQVPLAAALGFRGLRQPAYWHHGDQRWGYPPVDPNFGVASGCMRLRWARCRRPSL